jgi:ketosteroid isomerase-like protein
VDDEELAAQRQIRSLLADYAARIDAGDFAGVGELFARATLRNDHDPRVVIAQGASEITELLERTIRVYDGLPLEQHLTTNVIVHVDAAGDRATARSVYVVFMAAPGFPLQATGAGRYEDEFGRDEAGWYFRDRLFVRELHGDTSAHTRV